ncbi:hypothetical protein ABW19_dt0202325 [Dactylella cylindrospora]|nr:hypothetical protein ABW19_dt0202325 [Dactylella cylindrospora]
MKFTALIPIFLLATSAIACPLDDEVHALAERDIEIDARAAEPAEVEPIEAEFDGLVARDDFDLEEYEGTEEGEIVARGETEGELMARATCNNGAGSGVCANKSGACNGGKFYPGFCPGSSAIQCCIKGTKLPTIPIGGCKKYVYTNGYKVMKKFPTLIKSVGCKGSRSYKSDHAVGKALDFMLKVNLEKCSPFTKKFR